MESRSFHDSKNDALNACWILAPAEHELPTPVRRGDRGNLREHLMKKVVCSRYTCVTPDFDLVGGTITRLKIGDGHPRS